MANYLFIATLIVVALVVLVLVIYLVGIIIALRKAGNHLQQLAGGLQKIERYTTPRRPSDHDQRRIGYFARRSFIC